MGKLVDLTGQRFGRLTVISRAENYITPKGVQYAMWNCICDCGNYTTVVSSALRCGRTKSCGCYHDECCSKRRYKHGESHSKLNDIWRAMKQRCCNPKNKDYYNYGGRGIMVCEEWERDYISFSKWAKSSGYKEGLTIDRINSNGDYCPENCRWADAKEQANNTRRNRIISYGGKDLTIAKWSEMTGIKYKTLVARINAGWSAERALTEIVKKDGY